MLETPNILHAIPLETKFVKLSVTTEKKTNTHKIQILCNVKNIKKGKKKKLLTHDFCIQDRSSRANLAKQAKQQK